MKIVKVTYQKTYSIGPYLTERIGFEAEPEPYIGHQYDGPNGMEKHDEVLTTLEKMADEWHKKAHPPLYQQESSPEIVRSFTPQQTGPSVMEIQTDKGPDDRIAAMIADIYSCTEIKVLEGYRLLAKTKPEFQAAYDQQMKKLNENA
jgi:hypothetical protein